MKLQYLLLLIQGFFKIIFHKRPLGRKLKNNHPDLLYIAPFLTKNIFIFANLLINVP